MVYPQGYGPSTDPSRGWPGLPVAGVSKPMEMPKVIKPLVYCEFRPSAESWCPVFACEEVEGLQVCFTHAGALKAALGEE